MQQRASDLALGRRIVVWGVTGSGKTTLARQLGAALNFPLIELDAIAHARGWNSATDEEFVERLTEALTTNDQAWILDGSYSRISHLYLSRADTLIWIHLPWRVSFWRLLLRTFRRSWTGEEVYAGSPARESLRLALFSRQSILWWGLAHHREAERNRRRRTAELKERMHIIELRSARDVDAFLAALQPPPRL
jgi:adenylate kinase family enzyme